MGTVSTRIEEGDGFKVLRYGLGSIVLIIGYPQSESDLIDARDAIAKQFDYEISMNGRRHGGHRSVRTAAIQKTLTAKWKDMGLRVEQVSVQEVRYPKSITSKYAEAQAAEIDKQKALNEQEVEKTKAEIKRIKAQGEADANKVLNDSLTDSVLRQHYIDALDNADQLIVTPDGVNTLVQPK